MRLEELLSVLPFYKQNQTSNSMDITGIENDHRKIKAGNMFVCIKGYTVDGHDLADAAIENGASVIVAERPLQLANEALVITVKDTTRALALLAAKYYDFPSTKFSVVGITGTNGKTTTTYLLEKIFQEDAKKTALIGTIQMKIGDATFPMKNTTPDALALQKAFHDMNEAEVDAAFMEVSSHALDLGRSYGTDFDVALFTNLSQDHLDYHKDMADYLRAKTLLFTGLGNQYDDNAKFAVLNSDDAASASIIKSTSQHILTYGLKTAADVMATDISYALSNTTFTLVTPRGNRTIKSHLIGTFNVYNMLAAATVALALDVSLDVIKRALEAITGVDGRFEQVLAGQDYAVIVDYAHTSDSLENVLETITTFKENKVYVVVGAGGDRDKTKRPLMAAVAEKYSDFVYLTSDNPRTEDPREILADMEAGMTTDRYEVIESRKAAIEKAVQAASSGDVILIAGKGHETYQEINGVRHDFDDREVARAAIKNREV